jgi:hypothetical protein
LKNGQEAETDDRYGKHGVKEKPVVVRNDGFNIDEKRERIVIGAT